MAGGWWCEDMPVSFFRRRIFREKREMLTDKVIDMMRRVRLGECGYGIGESLRWVGNQ